MGYKNKWIEARFGWDDPRFRSLEAYIAHHTQLFQ
jgi:hypothetical protein